MMKWSRPIELQELLKGGTAPVLAGKGVYRLYVLDEGGCPVKIPRAFADDPTGTLYVGCTPKEGMGTLRSRLMKLRRTLNRRIEPGRYPHRGGWNLQVFDILEGLRRASRPATQVLVTACDLGGGKESHLDAAHGEAVLLLAYRAVFGDTPPGNLSAGAMGSDTVAIHETIRWCRENLSTANWFEADWPRT